MSRDVEIERAVAQGKAAEVKRRNARKSAAGEYVRGDALVTTRQHGKEFVAMDGASRDVAHLLAIIKWQEECMGEALDASDRALADQIATDYGVPRWHSEH